MDDALPTRETLLIKIRDAQDAAAWAEFADLYTPLIRHYCILRGVNQSDVDDVTQEVLKTVSTAIQNFEYDPDKGTFRGWLFIITRSKVYNHFNKKKRQPQGSGRTTVHQMLEKQPDPQEEVDWDLDYKRQMFQWASEKVRSEFAPKIHAVPSLRARCLKQTPVECQHSFPSIRLRSLPFET